MGILDSLFSDNPNDAAYLALASGLLSGKGNFSSILGNSLAGAQGVYSQAKEAGQKNQLTKMQIEEMARRMKQQEQAQAGQDAFRATLLQQTSPQMQASQQALAGGGGPTMANAAKMPQVDPMQTMARDALRTGMLNPLDYMKMQQKDNTPVKMGRDDRLVTPQGKELIGAAPEKDPEQIRLLKMIYGDGTPAYQQALQALGIKATTHNPTVQVSYGAPLPALNPTTNEAEFVRPDNKGGMTFTGIKPPPQNRDTKLPAELQRMQIAGDAMGSLLNDYEAMLKKHNPRDPTVQFSPAIKAEMLSLKRNVELQFKELQALGALAGPDVEIMRQALADPFSWQGAFYGRDGLMAQIAQAKSLIKKRSDAVLKSQGRDADKGKPADNDPLGLRK